MDYARDVNKTCSCLEYSTVVTLRIRNWAHVETNSNVCVVYNESLLNNEGQLAAGVLIAWKNVRNSGDARSGRGGRGAASSTDRDCLQNAPAEAPPSICARDARPAYPAATNLYIQMTMSALAVL